MLNEQSVIQKNNAGKGENHCVALLNRMVRMGLVDKASF